jgi:hypothetical protein
MPDNVTRDEINAGIYAAGSPCLRLFHKSANDMAMRFNHAIAACIVQMAKRDGGETAVRFFDKEKREPIEVEPRVSIYQKETLAESILSAPKSTSGTGWTILDLDVNGEVQSAVNAAVPDVTGDALSAIAC